MTSATHDVDVSGIAATTTKEHLLEFFTFCGKIVDIDYNTTAHTAVLHFEKPSAAKTALMLNGGALDGANLVVSSPTEHADNQDPAPHTVHPIDQTDKPRSAIAAEYLARGYTLSDSILQRAIELDNQRGISKRFLDYFHSIDHTVGEKAIGKEQTVSGALTETIRQAGERAKQVDEQKGISVKATDYYTRALSSPWGQKVKAFYTTTSKQVFDIHDEAKRIAATQRPAGSAAEQPTHTSTAVGTSAPPSAPIVTSAGIPATEPKTNEAPTVV